MSIFLYPSMILIYFELWIPKLEFLNPKKKKKFLKFVDVFFLLSTDFSPPPLAPCSIRFAFRSQVTKRKVIQCYSRGKGNGPIVKRKGYEGVGGRTFAEIENRTPAMKYTLRLCRFSTLLGDSSYPPSLCFPP